MFQKVIRALLAAFTVTMLNRGRRLSLQMLKIQSARYYLQGLKIANLTVLGLLGLGMVVVLIGIGLLIFHAGVFALLPWSVEVKGVVALCLGLFYVVIAAVAIRVALNEKRWMDKAGISKMVQRAVLTQKLERKAA